MAYQVTARKWRPQRFSDMVGQEHIARTLRNAIVTGRIAHAYLFVGPRGIGKTTSARIFAKAMNCKHPVDGEPCCECSSCKAIAEESSVDVIEIDAATHTQVEKARDICEDVLHLPISSKYKIYIIDEVHMLSKSAWNALLKTIEEPPAHAKFIFATTEVNKVLPTVISRCQRFDLCRIPAELIAKRLEYIASEEKIKISRSALDVIARAADGGMRDAQSLLDQLVSFFGTGDNAESISEAQALSLFGLTAPGEMESLLRSILANDRASAILSIHQFAAQGKNLETLFEEILTWLRGILLVLILPDPGKVLDENPEKIKSYRNLAAVSRPDTLQILMEQLSACSYMLREAINKQVFMETILLKAMRAAHAVKVEDLLIRLNEIRRNGELDGIEKVPSLARFPVQGPAFVPAAAPVPPPCPAASVPPPVQEVQPVPPVAVAEIRQEVLTDDGKIAAPPAPPPVQESVRPAVLTDDAKVSAPPAPPLPEPVSPAVLTDDGKAAASPPVSPEGFPKTENPVREMPVTDVDVNSEPAAQEQVMNNDETVTDAGEEMTEDDLPGDSRSDDESGEESVGEEGEPPVEDLPDTEDTSGSVMLKDRFSPELLWRKLIDAVQEKQPSLGGLMAAGVPDRIEKSSLHVGFDAKDDIMAFQMVSKSADLIRGQLGRIAGDQSADVVFQLKEGLHETAVKKRSLEELKRDAGKNPMVCEVADLFSGVIVDVME